MKRSRVWFSCSRSMSFSPVLFSCSQSMSIIIPTALALIILCVTSCSSNDLDITSHQQAQPLHEVTVTLTGINFTLEPTRASDATPSQAGITHIALKVFDSTGKAVADTCQIASKLTQGFNQLGVVLPAGTYTFVAVAHSATDNSVPCVTITSATEATLPEGIVPVLYSHVESVTITNTNNQSVPLDMGQRVNATLNIVSTDVVPDDVSQMTIDIKTPSGSYTNIDNTTHVQFNPTTGLATNNPRYGRLIPSTVGNRLDASFNILIPAQSFFYRMKIVTKDAQDNVIPSYTRVFEDVPFKQAFTTNATGVYFRYANSSSLTFDITTETLDFEL